MDSGGSGLIAQSSFHGFFRDRAFVVYTAIATCTVVVPIVVTILFPHRMEPRLLAAKEWIAAHSTGVSATQMIMIGGFVIYVGFSG